QSTRRICERRFQRDLEDHSTLTTPSFENIRTFLLAAFIAMEQPQTHLAWTYISIAAGMCHSLGYHRKCTLERTVEAEHRQLVRQVFWTVYLIDRSTYFVLGFKSNFVDEEIDQPHHDLSDDPQQRPWDEYFRVYTAFSRQQGRFQRTSLSAAAANLCDKQRQSIVDGISTDISDIQCTLQSINFQEARYPDSLTNAVCAAHNQAYSLLTCVHWARSDPQTRPMINHECQRYARLALITFTNVPCTAEGSLLLRDTNLVTWMFTTYSFVPMMVVYICLLKANDPSDRDLLARTHHILETNKERSKDAARLCEVVSVFL
ncbi:hypothetical protein BDZ85DRAFT_171476, partial [Elsinoe ampelina]